MARFNRHRPSRNEITARLERILTADPDVILAYLFGSMARNDSSRTSDIDVAVVVKEDCALTGKKLQLLLDVSRGLDLDDVDLVMLNKAPLTLKARAVRDGIVLVEKEPFFRHAFESLVMRKYFDFSIKEKNILEERFGIGR